MLAAVPYFWSDQYSSRIQFAGLRRRGDTEHVLEGIGPGRHVALFGRAGVLVGALTVDAPRQLLRYRGMIARRAPVAEALAAPLEAAS
jgi:hypothetical protein